MISSLINIPLYLSIFNKISFFNKYIYIYIFVCLSKWSWSSGFSLFTKWYQVYMHHLFFLLLEEFKKMLQFKFYFSFLSQLSLLSSFKFYLDFFMLLAFSSNLIQTLVEKNANTSLSLPLLFFFVLPVFLSLFCAKREGTREKRKRENKNVSWIVREFFTRFYYFRYLCCSKKKKKKEIINILALAAASTRLFLLVYIRGQKWKFKTDFCIKIFYQTRIRLGRKYLAFFFASMTKCFLNFILSIFKSKRKGVILSQL